jgi:hypothetical protein
MLVLGVASVPGAVRPRTSVEVGVSIEAIYVTDIADFVDIRKVAPRCRKPVRLG